MLGRHSSNIPVRRQVGAGLAAGAVADPGQVEALERQIADGTAGVKAHLDRINIHAAAGDADRTYGALLDLFVATSPTAAEVRNRALYWSRDVVATDLHRLLSAQATQEVGPQAALPSSDHSLLHHGSVEILGRTSPPNPTPGAIPASPVTGPTNETSLSERLPILGNRISGVPTFKLTKSLLAPVVTAMETTHRDSVATRVFGDFGEVVITPGSVAIRVKPGADLSTVHPDETTIESSRISAADLTGAFTPEIGLWNLAIEVAAQRLPESVNPTAVYHLDRMPDLALIHLGAAEARILGKLSTQARRLDELLADEPGESWSVVTAAWVCGMLRLVTPAPGGPAAQPTPSARPAQPAASPRADSLRAFLADLPQTTADA